MKVCFKKILKKEGKTSSYNSKEVLVSSFNNIRREGRKKRKESKRLLATTYAERGKDKKKQMIPITMMTDVLVDSLQGVTPSPSL